MGITETAAWNQARLCPGHVSTLKVTDPELIEGNLRVGYDRARLIDVLTQLLPDLGYPRTLNALRCLDEVAPPTSQAIPNPDPTPSQPGA